MSEMRERERLPRDGGREEDEVLVIYVARSCNISRGDLIIKCNIVPRRFGCKILRHELTSWG